MIFFPENIEAVDYTYTKVKMEVTYVSGTPYIIEADIQPGTGEDEGNSVDSSPQGRKEVGIIRIYTDQKLKVAEEGTTTRGTVVTWSEKKWEIIQELSYQKGSIFSLVDHHKYFAQLVTDGDLT